MKINKEHSNNNKQVSIIYGDDNSININVFNNKILMEIAGSFDNNLKELEKISGSKIYFRGNTITIKGEKNANEKVRDAIEYLIERFKLDKKIDKNDIVASLNKDMIRDVINNYGSVVQNLRLIKRVRENPWTQQLKTCYTLKHFRVE